MFGIPEGLEVQSWVGVCKCNYSNGANTLEAQLNHMVPEIELPFFHVMASANRSSSSLIGKRKTREGSASGSVSVEVEVAEQAETNDSAVEDVREIPSFLAPITTNLKSTGVTDTEQKAKEEECCTTPRSEEHKIPPMTSCPPAPRKPKSTPRKRNPATSPTAVRIPCDFPDLELLFGSDRNSDNHQSKKKKRKEKSKTEENEGGGGSLKG